jgi:microcin C transport system ATP-binding protein
MTLLQVENLGVSFGGAKAPVMAVRDVSFRLDKGETLALVGESGSGKSLTALSLLQLLPYPHASHPPQSSILFADQQLCRADEKLMRTVRGNRIGMIFQEPMTALNPLHNVGKQVAESLILHRGLRAGESRARCLELFKQVGMPDPEAKLDAYPHELSGGQRQRVMIAMALANEPDLLIADEPTTALDVTVQSQILKLLQDLQRQHGMAMLLITHDLGIVKHMAQRVAVMHAGSIVEQNVTAEIFARAQHPYTRQLMAAAPKGKPITLADNAETILQAENIKVHFPIRRGLLRRTQGYVRAVDDVSLHLRRCETIGVVGESGSGKSTLGLALLRLLHNQKQVMQGRIVFLGQDFRALAPNSLRQQRQQFQIVFQDPYGSLNPRLTVEQIIGEGLLVHDRAKAKRRQELVAEILGEVGLEPAMANRYPHEFSGGQRQRIAIARAMILRPKCVILDEPTSALDMSVQAQIIALLKDLQQRHGLGYLFISHDLRVIRAMAHQVIVMRHGAVVESGPAEAIFAAPQQDYTRELLAAALA